MKINKLILIASLAALTLPATAYALPWSWDMFDQKSHKAQEEKALPMPQGIVAVQGEVVMKDRVDAARVKSPFPPTKESIARGLERYKIFCATCHGDGGKGDGPVGLKYVAPTDLTTEYVQNKPDGELYFTIVSGGLAIMPSYGDSVAPDDRWHIVNYIKNGLVVKKPAPAAEAKVKTTAKKRK